MKKFAFLLALLVLAAPAMATVTVSCDIAGSTCTVSYASTEPNEIRAFALNITVDSGTITSVTAAKEGESTSASKGYGIFPGTIYIVDGDVCDWNTPVAPSGDPEALGGIGTGGITVELGSLYEDGNAPLQTGPYPLLSFEMSDSGATVTIAENARRGGIVMKDPDETVANNLPATCGLCTVPDVTPLDLDAARAAIIAAGLVVGTETGAWNAEAQYEIFGQSPVGGTPAVCGSAVNLDVSAGPGPPANCLPTDGNYPVQITQFDAYVTKLWDPTSWCASGSGGTGFQCHGDADGKKSSAPYYYRVYTGDLGLLVSNWKIKRLTFPSGGHPRADFDHKRSSAPYYYCVYTSDLGRLVMNWKKKDSAYPAGANCPLTDVANNAYVDPTP